MQLMNRSSRACALRTAPGLTFSAILFSPFIASACHDVQPVTRSARTAVTTADSVVANDTLVTAAGRRLTSTLRIDGYENELEPVTWLAVGRDGSIVVSQPMSVELLFFDAHGDTLAAMGRAGDGPGEFRSLGLRAGWMADTLWVWDHQHMRVTFISPSRRFVRTANLSSLRWPRHSTIGKPAFKRPLNVRAFYGNGTATVLSVPTRQRRGRGLTGSSIAMLHTRQVGEIIDVIGWVPPDSSISGYISNDGSSGGGVRMPFYPVPLDAASPDGNRFAIALAHIDGARAGTFSVTSLDSRGDTIFSRDYRFRGDTIPPDVLSRMNQAMERVAAQSPASADAVSRVRVPKVYSPIEDIIVGADYSIWLKLHTQANERWLTIDGGGAVRDTVSLPPRTKLLAADSGNVWVAQSDEWDVPTIIRYTTGSAQTDPGYKPR